ncbi:putative zinc finger matrin-type protein snu-23 [Diplonema papillatum]|nr:putative zinc finger matrin-type protein snu-23 [Diplonema papillatum]WGM50014.1 ZMAT2 [Diplonema papillatum]
MSEVKAVANVERKQYDLEEYAKKAEERKEREAAKQDGKTVKQPPPLKPKAGFGVPQREWLSARDHDLRLEEGTGKRTLIDKSTDGKGGGAWECLECDMQFRDSLSYVAHKNGKKHQKMVGVSMRVQRVGISAVKAKLNELKEQKAMDEDAKTREIELQVKRKQLAWEKEATAKRDAKTAAKKRKKEETRRTEEHQALDTRDVRAVPTDDDMMRIMGFSAFK